MADYPDTLGECGCCGGGEQPIPMCCEPNFGPPEITALVETLILDPTVGNMVGNQFSYGYVWEHTFNVGCGSYIFAYVKGAWNYGDAYQEGQELSSDNHWVVSHIPQGCESVWEGQAMYPISLLHPVPTSYGHFLYVKGIDPRNPFLLSDWNDTAAITDWQHFVDSSYDYDETRPPGEGFGSPESAQSSMKCQIIRFLVKEGTAAPVFRFTDHEIGVGNPSHPGIANFAAPAPIGPPEFRLYRVFPALQLLCLAHMFYHEFGSSDRTLCRAKYRLKNPTCGYHKLTFRLLTTGGVVDVTVSNPNPVTLVVQPLQEIEIPFEWHVTQGNTQVVSTLSVANGGCDTIPDIVVNHAPVIVFDDPYPVKLWYDTGTAMDDHRVYWVWFSNRGNGATVNLRAHITLTNTPAHLFDWISGEDLDQSMDIDGGPYPMGFPGQLAPKCTSGFVNGPPSTNQLIIPMIKNGAVRATLTIALTDGTITYPPKVYHLDWSGQPPADNWTTDDPTILTDDPTILTDGTRA